MMDPQLLQHHRNEIRTVMQKKFMDTFISSAEFPFLQSIGITHVFQAFEANHDEIGFLGLLHIWYHETMWETEWIDTEEQGLDLISDLREAKLYNEVKLVKVSIDKIHQRTKMERMKVIKERIDRYDNQQTDEDIILN